MKGALWPAAPGRRGSVAHVGSIRAAIAAAQLPVAAASTTDTRTITALQPAQWQEYRPVQAAGSAYYLHLPSGDVLGAGTVTVAGGRTRSPGRLPRTRLGHVASAGAVVWG